MHRRLTIIRHAKSDWGDASLPDIERPLSARGLRDAPAMGQRMRERGDDPGLILCSPAVRARATAGSIAEAIGYPPDRVLVEPSIYEAPVSALVEVVRHCPDEVPHLMMVGHNPGSQQLIQFLTGAPWGHFGTCAVADLGIEADSWQAIGPGVAKLESYWYPKMFKE